MHLLRIPNQRGEAAPCSTTPFLINSEKLEIGVHSVTVFIPGKIFVTTVQSVRSISLEREWVLLKDYPSNSIHQDFLRFSPTVILENDF